MKTEKKIVYHLQVNANHNNNASLETLGKQRLRDGILNILKEKSDFTPFLK